MFQLLICVIIGYIFGSFSTGYFIGKFYKIDDIRKYGSGNSGATNALRTMGKAAGAITLLGDSLKVIIPMMLVRFLFKLPDEGVLTGSSLFIAEFDTNILLLITGFATVLGHNFPFYLKFKGGRGITVTGWTMLIFNPWFGLIAFIIFSSTIAITRYVSLASLLLSLSFPICMFIFYQDTILVILSLFFTVLAFVRHIENIKRLINGTENKLGQKASTNT